MNIDKIGDISQFALIGTVLTVAIYCGFAANTVSSMQNETSDPDDLYRVEQKWDENKPLVLQPVTTQPLAKNTLDLIPR